MWTSSSCSSSWSLSSSSSTNNNKNNKPNNIPKTMEEVWKDISQLASEDIPLQGAAAHSKGMILQDFFSKDPQPATAVSASPPPPPPPPPTMLSLNNDHHFSSLLLQPHNYHHHHHRPANIIVNNISHVSGEKRFQDSDGSSSDRRHKRMIKNRESAARSRARKQAYTNELELEVAQLLEENARLKEQQQQLYRAAAAQQQKNKTLQRTSTAPF